jgi:biotin carboxylase
VNPIVNTEPKSTSIQRIVIVEPISSGVALIDEAKSMGLEVIIASFDRDDRQIPKALRDRIDGLIVVDTNDENALTETLISFAWGVRVDAIIPGFEYFVPIVSKVNAKLNLPGLPLESVDAVRIKSLMRQRLQSQGVKVPTYAIADSLSELEVAASRIGFPSVLKPVDSAGSIHVSKVDSMVDLRNAYAAIRADMCPDLNRQLSKEVQLEAYVDGSEYSIEGFVVHGKPQIVSITEKLLGPEPYFVELGHIVGAELPPETVKTIQNYVEKVVVALGVTLGPFHCEIRLGCDGPVVIELGARLPGDHICELIALARGISLPRIMIEAYLGSTPSTAETVSSAKYFAGIRFFTVLGLTHYTQVTGFKEIEAEPGFVKSGLSIQAGETIPPLIDFRGRLGFAIFTASTYQEIQNKLAFADRLITFA